ncbi:MAG TPA: DUF418 domain-containing protein [Pyrinomonadaceae bacterium]|nr:DUF418 domain-containing protein [Pyrinomonadaceae bacterium]
MSASSIGPITQGERIDVVDVLRGLAVGGILIGNMQWFAGYGMMPPTLAAAAPIADQITNFLVHFFIEGKFYSIFSLLFGFGFALQIARAEERGDVKASVFKRRLFWLLVIGLLHAYLLWAGDILSIYALMGFILILFRRKSDASLLKWAFWLMVIPILTYTLLVVLFNAFVPADSVAAMESSIADRWPSAVAQVTQGNFLSIMTGYNLEYIVGRYAGLIIGMRLPKILAMFLVGLYAYRRRLFHDLDTNRLVVRKTFIYSLILGLIGNTIFAYFAGNESPFPPTFAGIVGVIGYAFGVPALAIAMAALVALMWPSWKKVLSIFAPVGRMALTNYIMQTVICVIIFYGYGFGLFGQFGALYATLTALAIFAFQIVASSLWLGYFKFGPLEWVWRQLTYKKRIDLRHKAETRPLGSVS